MVNALLTESSFQPLLRDFNVLFFPQEDIPGFNSYMKTNKNHKKDVMPYLLGQLLKKKLQDKKYSKSWKVIDKLKYLVQLVGMNNDESTMENNMAVPQKKL